MKVSALALVATGAVATSTSQQTAGFVPPVGARCQLRAAGTKSSSKVQMKLWDFGLNREVNTRDAKPLCVML